MAEVGGDGNPRAGRDAGEPQVGRPEGLELRGAAVFDERRLVEADPRRTGSVERREQLGVRLEQPVEHREPREPWRRDRAAQEKGRGAEEHRGGLDPERPGLLQLAERLGGLSAEGGLRADLRDQLVVVRVEPLGELERRDRHAVRLGASRHGEVALHAPTPPERPEPRGDGADGDGCVEHVVVEREVVGRDEADPGCRKAAPVVPADAGSDLQERALVDAPGPVALERPLELAVPPDAGHPVHRRPHATARPAPARLPDPGGADDVTEHRGARRRHGAPRRPTTSRSTAAPECSTSRVAVSSTRRPWPEEMRPHSRSTADSPGSRSSSAR